MGEDVFGRIQVLVWCVDLISRFLNSVETRQPFFRQKCLLYKLLSTNASNVVIAKARIYILPDHQTGNNALMSYTCESKLTAVNQKTLMYRWMDADLLGKEGEWSPSIKSFERGIPIKRNEPTKKIRR